MQRPVWCSPKAHPAKQISTQKGLEACTQHYPVYTDLVISVCSNLPRTPIEKPTDLPSTMGTQLETTSVGNNPPKFSRYRSVRRAAETQKWTGEGSSASNAKPPPTGTIARSMSRYHRPKTPTAATNPPTPAVNQSHPPVPALPPALQASQPVSNLKHTKSTLP